MYYGQTDDNKPALVLVGVTSDENDMEAGLLADDYVPCPPRCGQSSRLNS
jgi:hypothetical protein